MILLPAMGAAQEAAWSALLDVFERVDHGWTLVGGQMVHLWCAERGFAAPRPTDDADAVLDVRAVPEMLAVFTGTLRTLGFAPQTSGDGLQHRWTRTVGADSRGVPVVAQVDVMVPDGVGERASGRVGAGGAATLETPGGSQALIRSEAVEVLVGGRVGRVRRPNLVGALVVKAAAHERQSGAAGARHRLDFATLVSMLAGRDLRGVEWGKADRRRLRAMTVAVRADRSAVVDGHGVEEAMGLLEEHLVAR